MNRLQSLDPRIRKLMRAICFCLLFVILFVFLSGAFIPRTGTTEDGMESRISKAYRGEPRDSIDTVFIGNSDIYRAISPVDLFHQTGITSAIAGRPNKQGYTGYSALPEPENHRIGNRLYVFRNQSRIQKRNFSAGSRSCQGGCGWPGAVEGNKCPAAKHFCQMQSSASRRRQRIPGSS